MAKKSHRKTENAENLTEDRCRKIKPPATGRTYVYDATQPALALCITASGSRTFYFAKRLGGKYIRTPIGKVGEVTVQQARDAVVRKLGDYVVKGVDPVEQKRQELARNVRENTTLGDLWDYYLESHARPHKRSWAEDEKRWKRHMLPWAKKSLSEIDPADVERLHKRVGTRSGPYEANRLLALLSVMFGKFARKIGYTGESPCVGIERFTEDERARYLLPEEIPAFFTALHSLRIKSPTAADALEMCIWTGARKGNVLSMEWSEVNLLRAEWVIPGDKFKTGKETTVPLVPQAVSILERRKAIAKPGEFVFPGRRRGQHISDITKPWKELLTTAGLEGIRMHDLRRTAGSWMAAGGTSLHLIGKALGHRTTEATAIYARVDLSPVRTALSGAAAAIEAAATKGNGNG